MISRRGETESPSKGHLICRWDQYYFCLRPQTVFFIDLNANVVSQFPDFTVNF